MAPLFLYSEPFTPTVLSEGIARSLLGVWSLVFGAMIPLGSLEVGAVAHWLGTPFALRFGAIICAASALVTLSVIRRREAQLAN